ncbi:TetR/AcrR family transcriptional regulator [Nonomuraea sp. NPDC049480]|uniref:TetR/AcrR family transcriptional regulator n=1 Tax=Nonomuraea sp. NPDC049480 TaxID=3364353 RepID=UPI0037A2F5CA
MTDSPESTSRRRERISYGGGREALLRAAVRVVARGGLRKLTYRAVAEEAGVTHGLVVHHFGSRDALIAEALAHSVRESIGSTFEALGEESEGMMIGLSAMVEADPDIQAFQYELLLEARRRPELRPHIQQLYAEYFGATERELTRMLPKGATPALTQLVFSALDGLVLRQLTLGGAENTDAALDELRGLLRAVQKAQQEDEEPASK